MKPGFQVNSRPTATGPLRVSGSGGPASASWWPPCTARPGGARAAAAPCQQPEGPGSRPGRWPVTTTELWVLVPQSTQNKTTIPKKLEKDPFKLKEYSRLKSHESLSEYGFQNRHHARAGLSAYRRGRLGISLPAHTTHWHWHWHHWQQWLTFASLIWHGDAAVSQRPVKKRFLLLRS